MKYIIYTAPIDKKVESVIFPDFIDFEFMALTLAEDPGNVLGAGTVTVDERGQFRCEDNPDSPTTCRGLADSTVLNHMDNAIMR